MKEDFLHYIWKFQKFNTRSLTTTTQETIKIKRVGDYNTTRSGPDFFNSQIYIDEQLWAGTVEIHINSSDWYVHHHEADAAYDNVILHVVWQDDVELYRKDGTQVPTLSLKEKVSPELLNNYQNLLQTSTNKWIYCEGQLEEIPQIAKTLWKEQLYIQRLIRKSENLKELVTSLKGDWEAVLYQQLFQNFGLNVNGNAFKSIARATDFSIVRKVNRNNENIEALFFGQAQLLRKTTEIEDVSYKIELLNQYTYYQSKYKLSNNGVLPVEFFRLRPPNFPTIRIAQFSALYSMHKDLFFKIIEAKNVDELYKLFEVTPGEFWNTHYTFYKESKPRKKKLSKAFVDLIIINTVIPVKFLYAQSIGNDIVEEIITIIGELPPEHNNITKGFANNSISIASALDSQAVIELKKEYCNNKKCLHCSFGNYLLNKGKKV
ncbi:DUF2851 family protein [Aquimarina sp. ERC-38]|uniref:DUF2851 family protein n=1 Tax=Aquimarina sp. ERC-38 TaxID=2949996 RepID=UPI002247DD6A|nr:DUF2851 family protein [Aquimarina sp. ERC-38]UZO79388.1 DUF2851 family protein [Aquimarina sp. ERC-38]